MRKFFLYGICMLFAPLLWGKAPFGIFDEAVQKQSNPQQLWTCILNGSPLTLDLVLPPSEEHKRAQWEDYVQNSFNMWFTQTAKIIEQSGRAEEFADVLPILKRGLVFGPDGLEEHVFVYDSVEALRRSTGSKKAVASANPKTRTIRIPVQEEFNRVLAAENAPQAPLWKTLVHEFGHQLGFIGQYPHETFLSIDEVHAQGYSSHANPQETVMSAVRQNGKIGCDDTDGIINMIDLQRNGAQGNRAGKSWESFCENSRDKFRDGKCVNCRSYKIRIGRSRERWIVNIGDGAKEYRLDSVRLLPQDIVRVKEKVVKRDKENRPIKTKTNNGATVYYEYFQSVIRKAAFIDDSLAWVESIYQDHQTNEYEHHLIFWSENSDIVMIWRKPSSFRYDEGFGSIELSCRPQPDNKLNCTVVKDSLTDPLHAWSFKKPYCIGDFRNMQSKTIEHEAAKAVVVNTLTQFFEQLPDKPLQ